MPSQPYHQTPFRVLHLALRIGEKTQLYGRDHYVQDEAKLWKSGASTMRFCPIGTNQQLGVGAFDHV